MSIDQQFINNLFNTTSFTNQLALFIKSQNISKQSSDLSITYSIETIIDDISTLLIQNFQTTINKEVKILYQSNIQLIKDIENIKTLLQTNVNINLKTQSTSADKEFNKNEQSVLFDGENSMDIYQMRKTVDQLHQRLNQISVINSFQLQSPQKYELYRIKGQMDEQLHDKINASIQSNLSRVEMNIQDKINLLQTKMNRKTEQLSSTLRNVLELINEHLSRSENKSPHKVAANTHATRIKSFLGFSSAYK